MMMMAEEGNVNLISAELAIRKELAYRKKVANLYPDSEEDFLPLKDPCPTKASSSNASASQLHEMSPSSSIPRAQNPSFMQGEDSVTWQYPTMNMGPPIMNMGPTMNVGPTYPGIEGTSAGILPFPPIMNMGPTMNAGPTYPGMVGTSAGILPFPPSMNMGPPIMNMGPTMNVGPTYPGVEGTSTGILPFPPSMNMGPTMNVGPTYPGMEGTSAGILPFPCYASQQPAPPPPTPVYDVNSLFFCKVCMVPCSGQISYEQHLKGQKHGAKLQLHQMIRNRNGPKKPQQPKCNVCEIWCSDENALRLHLRVHLLGQKHKAKLLETGQGDGGRQSQQRWC